MRGRLNPATALLGVGAAVGLAVTPAFPASAALVDRGHGRFIGVFPDSEVCGVPVDTTVRFLGSFETRVGAGGHQLLQSTGGSTVTFTNPASGRAVTIGSVARFKDLGVTSDRRGTLTLRTAITGIPEPIVLPDGTRAVRDVGRLVLSSTFTDGGTPGDPDDDVFGPSAIVSVSRPRPGADIGFTLFCATLAPRLS